MFWCFFIEPMHTEWLLWNINPTLLYCANRQSPAKSFSHSYQHTSSYWKLPPLAGQSNGSSLCAAFACVQHHSLHLKTMCIQDFLIIWQIHRALNEDTSHPRSLANCSELSMHFIKALNHESRANQPTTHSICHNLSKSILLGVLSISDYI